MSINRNLPPIPVSQFAMVPRSDVPRSRFTTRSAYKTTFDADYLVPFFVDEVLPGDYFSGDVTIFCRMATPLFPIMDNIHLETFFFFVPNRIVWDNWVKFMGEQKAPGDSISYVMPLVSSGANGFAQFSPADYFGLPVEGTSQVTQALGVCALPFRAYNRIWNEWFRDENLQVPAFEYTGDAQQDESNYPLLKRNKRPDYFTSALPWPQKGGTAISVPLGGQAVVRTAATEQWTAASAGLQWRQADGSSPGAGRLAHEIAGGISALGGVASGTGAAIFPSNLVADLSTATGATINAMRLAVATQQFLEKDARGGTRYTELLRMHFGVDPQDMRLQRPEYIGGGSQMLQTQAIPQTSATGIDGGTSPIGSLGATTVGNGRHRFSYAASEHGFIIGLVNVRADITYQQGIHRMWNRYYRFDFYHPTFAFLGEQVIENREIYAVGGGTQDVAAFGYQERWAEYRYRPSRITGQFRSGLAGTMDAWHLAEQFAGLPALNSTFLQSFTNIERIAAAGELTAGQQFLLDSVIDISATRPLPIRSVPGLMRF